MRMTRSVVIDCFPASAARYVDDHAIVAIDVIRATTMAVTAVAAGRRCLVAADLEDAFAIRDRIFRNAVLAGELAGDMPPGFDMNNSPAELAWRDDVQRPLVMLSSSGTQLMLEASRSAHGAFIACFRNFAATARHLAGRGGRVAVIGAGSRNEFREEDQMCCAWVAALLVEAGYRPQDEKTVNIIESWRGAPATACETGNSVAYLRRSGQLDDFGFVTEHVDDLDMVCPIEGNEVRPGVGLLPFAASVD
jgi:2-phosphosulfolactate phosphatase